jgi:hypothetical protein
MEATMATTKLCSSLGNKPPALCGMASTLASLCMMCSVRHIKAEDSERSKVTVE